MPLFQETDGLHYREIISVCLICFFLTILCLHAFKISCAQSFFDHQDECLRQTVVVTVRGAVFRPGRYHFEKGVKLEEVLLAAELMPNAEVSNLDFQQKITKSRRIKVPQQRRSKQGRRVNRR
ncbi:MAG: hypothetical protein ACSNEK_07700 [Parachlamydiaceae bacterium]